MQKKLQEQKEAEEEAARLAIPIEDKIYQENLEYIQNHQFPEDTWLPLATVSGLADNNTAKRRQYLIHMLNNDTQKTSTSKQNFQLSDLLVQMMGNIETAKDGTSI